jgi:hypothetical protein
MRLESEFVEQQLIHCLPTRSLLHLAANFLSYKTISSGLVTKFGLAFALLGSKTMTGVAAANTIRRVNTVIRAVLIFKYSSPFLP